MVNFTRLMQVRWAVVCFILLLLPGRSPHAIHAAQIQPDIPGSYQSVAENDQFQLYVDSTSLAFKLLDKRSGYLWHSGVDEPLEDDRLNTSWRAFAQGGISIEYFDARAINRRASLANSEHELAVTPIDSGITANIRFLEYGIALQVRVQLEEDGIRVEIPFASIVEENPDFRLARVYVYPFMGSTRGSSIPGYMFLPDGVGSLIPLADSTRAQIMFYGRYYGSDLGMIGIQPYDWRVNSPIPIGYPVFGMVHGEGENAFLSVIEQGAAYGELQVHPAGIITNFNFLYNAFIYNESYFQATNRSGAGVTTTQRQLNAFDVVVHYRFLTGEAADYVGMAHNYQDYLIDHQRLASEIPTQESIGIRLEFLGGDKERVLFFDRFIPMTTIQQMTTILDGLNISNSDVIYYGWQPLGASTVPPTAVMVEPSLGSVDALRALADSLHEGGGHFSLYLEPQAAYWGEAGYSTRIDLAMSITNINIEGFTRLYNHYFTFESMQQRFTSLAGDLSRVMNAGLALDSIGTNLYSDFRQGHTRNRESMVAAYETLLAESPVPLSFYRPNDYFLGMARAYYDMPLGDNGYIYAAQTVPFLPIVLSGHIPYYGNALNFSSDRQRDLLRHVEYGIYPSYFLTHEPTANMLSTPSAWIYTSAYAQWGDEIRTTYAWMNDLLFPVRGQTIVDHDQLAEGVYATRYANGLQIIVNYNDEPFVTGDLTVSANNAALVENGR